MKDLDRLSWHSNIMKRFKTCQTDIMTLPLGLTLALDLTAGALPARIDASGTPSLIAYL